MLSQNAKYLLNQRYCKSGESPEDVFKRTALALSLGDEKFEERLYDLMINEVFLPNSPTLFNAPKGNLHACYLLPIEDSIISIFKTIKDMALIFQSGGGVGINFSALREKDSSLSNGGKSSGVISFMKIFDNVVETVKQGGRRRGALMGVLDYNHPEIFNFITSKLEGKLQNFNISVLVTNDFMKNVDNPRKTIKLISPKNGEIVGEARIKDIFDLICFASWINGDPALLFYDRINKDNPLYNNGKGVVIKATNPCQPKDALLLDGDFLRRIDSTEAKTWKSWKTGIKEVLELTLSNGMNIRFTPEHKILLENGCWCEAKDCLNKHIKLGLGNRTATSFKSKTIILGFLYGIFNKKLPKWILFENSNKVASFLRGLFEARGNIDIDNKISLKTTNLKTIKNLQIILASFGIPSFIKVSFHMRKIKSPILKYSIQIIPENSYKFKEKIGFISNKKNLKIKKINRKDKTKIKVVSIKNLGNMEVWDYSMNSEPHYNFCQGVIAKNCAEVPMPPYSACCLGSINLSKFVWKNKFNFDKFYDICKFSTKALANINKISSYPIPEIAELMQKYNPVGVGVMGFADMLIKLGIYYDSQECLDLIDKIGAVYKQATLDFDTENFYFYRRIIAPTGSLSILANCSSGIEPIFDNVFERRLTIGKIEETRDIYNSSYVRTAHQVSPEWHVKVLAQWQKWVDGGLSKTVNLPKEATIDDIKEIYKLAWNSDCKGITVYRDGCRDQQVLYHRPSSKSNLETEANLGCKNGSCSL